MPVSHDAFIEVKDGRYFLAIWFLAAPDNGDVLMTVYRDDPASDWEMRYRFRYYVDEKAHDSADRRSHYVGTIPKGAPEVEVLTKMREAVNFMRAKYPKVEEVLIQSSSADAVSVALTLRPWAHAKQVPV